MIKGVSTRDVGPRSGGSTSRTVKESTVHLPLRCDTMVLLKWADRCPRAISRGLRGLSDEDMVFVSNTSRVLWQGWVRESTLKRLSSPILHGPRGLPGEVLGSSSDRGLCPFRVSQGPSKGTSGASG